MNGTIAATMMSFHMATAVCIVKAERSGSITNRRFSSIVSIAYSNADRASSTRPNRVNSYSSSDNSPFNYVSAPANTPKIAAVMAII